MNAYPPDAFGWMAGFGVLSFVIGLVIVAVVILLEVLILYTIIWRGVRRGILEADRRRAQFPPPQHPNFREPPQ